jgi:hypothetical protein
MLVVAHLVKKFPLFFFFLEHEVSLCIPKISSLISILSEINPVHTLTPYFFNVCFNQCPHIYAQDFQIVSFNFPIKILYAFFISGAQIYVESVS